LHCLLTVRKIYDLTLFGYKIPIFLIIFRSQKKLALTTMKFMLYGLLFVCCLGYAQQMAAPETNGFSKPAPSTTAVLLKKEDFKLLDGRMRVIDFPCKISNENDCPIVLVSVVCQQNAFEKMGVEKINDMILQADEKVRHSLKTNHLYLPREIRMAYIPDSHDWSLTNSFSEQDQQGTVVERLLAVDFDAEGKFAVMKRIL
jgi:hypothetical protein